MASLTYYRAFLSFPIILVALPYGMADPGPIGPGQWACHVNLTNGTYPYGMGRARDDRDVAQDLARELADIAAQLAALKGEASAWLSDESYDALRHRLEDAHALVEAAEVEARRRVRLQRSSEGRT
jgi:hypothetical protein